VLVDEQHGCLRIGHRVDVLGQRPADVERRERTACPWHREEQFEIAVGVHRQRGDERAVFDAERAQRGGQAWHARATSRQLRRRSPEIVQCGSAGRRRPAQELGACMVALSSFQSYDSERCVGV